MLAKAASLSDAACGHGYAAEVAARDAAEAHEAHTSPMVLMLFMAGSSFFSHPLACFQALPVRTEVPCQ